MKLKLSENIKKYRKEMNLTQEGLAEAFGVTVGAVSKWESGSTVPDILTMMELADFFNVSMDILLGYNISSKTIEDISGRIIRLAENQQYTEAVSEAENKLRTELETDFNNREKYPYRTFAGPSDFGALTFEYPKTWSVYVPNDASKAQDFHAYFNPGLVNVVENKTVMALRVSILNTLTDQVKERYSNKIKTGKMTVSSKVVNKVNVDVYKGQLDSNYNGIVCIFKIRDKTVVIQTDAYLFEPDFNRILETVRFNS